MDQISARFQDDQIYVFGELNVWRARVYLILTINVQPKFSISARVLPKTQELGSIALISPGVTYSKDAAIRVGHPGFLSVHLQCVPQMLSTTVSSSRQTPSIMDAPTRVGNTELFNWDTFNRDTFNRTRDGINSQYCNHVMSWSADISMSADQLISWHWNEVNLSFRT